MAYSKIFILGNTGSGKSTFINEFMKKYNGDGKYGGQKYGKIDDRYEINDLEKFYSNIYTYAFPHEVRHLLSAIDGIISFENNALTENVDNILFDRSFIDIHVFTEALNKLNVLEEREYEILKSYNELNFKLFMREIDMLVYLENTIPVLINNINKRGRKPEVDALNGKTKFNDMDNTFLKLLVNCNDEMENLVYNVIPENYRNINLFRIPNIAQLDINSSEYQDKLKFLDMYINNIFKY